MKPSTFSLRSCAVFLLWAFAVVVFILAVGSRVEKILVSHGL